MMATSRVLCCSYYIPAAVFRVPLLEFFHVNLIRCVAVTYGAARRRVRCEGTFSYYRCEYQNRRRIYQILGGCVGHLMGPVLPFLSLRRCSDQSVNQSIKVFLEWPKWRSYCKVHCRCKMSVTKARKWLAEQMSFQLSLEGWQRFSDAPMWAGLQNKARRNCFWVYRAHKFVGVVYGWTLIMF